MNKPRYIEFTTSVLDEEFRPIKSIRTRIPARDGVDHSEASYIAIDHITILEIGRKNEPRK